MSAYRRDIDGLRSLAIIPVVLFHAGVETVSGGFVGVDVFFVISGYLITSIIVKDLAQERFSLVTFYERRARRIMPALLTMMAIVLGVGWFIYMPGDFAALGASIAAAVFFVSNILFWSQTGYFSPGVLEIPLLHTWSLAIEEQFYIFLPPLLMLLHRFRLKIGMFLLALTAMSLLLSGLTTQLKPDAAYYLMPWRAWELGLGSLLALGMGPRLENALLRNIAALAGFCAILTAVFLFDETTTFPGFSAALPCIGAALILQAGRFGPSLTGQFLGTGPLVFIGLISYSLYLWHWPIIVFYSYWTLSEPQGIATGLIILASVIAATISWRFVERPFRAAKGEGAYFTRNAIFGLTAIVSVVIATAGFAVSYFGGVPSRLPDTSVKYASFADSKISNLRACVGRDAKWIPPNEPCVFGAQDTQPGFAVWGDSHGPALLPGLSTRAQASGASIELYSRAGCFPALDVERLDGKTGRCIAYGAGSFENIISNAEIHTVVLVARFALATKGYLSDHGLSELGWGPTLYSDAAGQTPAQVNQDRHEFIMSRFEATVQKLLEAQKRVVIVYPTPEVGFKVPTTLAKLAFQNRNPENFTVAKSLYDARNSEVITRLDGLPDNPALLRVYPSAKLCNDTECLTSIDGAALYHDDDHLSLEGAEFVSELFADVFDDPKSDSAQGKN